MDENRRNRVISRNEDIALNKYLDSRDAAVCDMCEYGEPTIEFGDKYICKSCYKYSVESTQSMFDNRE